MNPQITVHIRRGKESYLLQFRRPDKEDKNAIHMTAERWVAWEKSLEFLDDRNRYTLDDALSMIKNCYDTDNDQIFVLNIHT